jgi:hypothetical protein
MLLVRCGSGVRGIYANHITIWVNAERSCCATSARTDRPTTTGRDGFAPNACRRQPPAVPPYLTPFLFPAREYHKHEPGCASDEPQAARGLRVRHDSRVAFWRKGDVFDGCGSIRVGVVALFASAALGWRFEAVL